MYILFMYSKCFKIGAWFIWKKKQYIILGTHISIFYHWKEPQLNITFKTFLLFRWLTLIFSKCQIDYANYFALKVLETYRTEHTYFQ